MIMNFTSPFVFLASEKVSSDSLFEGFQVDLESTANLVKSLADFNPTV
ncbi:TPA: conjugal transfer protein TrbL, partial [Streptococcus suis]